MAYLNMHSGVKAHLAKSLNISSLYGIIINREGRRHPLTCSLGVANPLVLWINSVGSRSRVKFEVTGHWLLKVLALKEKSGSQSWIEGMRSLRFSTRIPPGQLARP